MRGNEAPEGGGEAGILVRPPPFFVVGADRSGTTLLRLYLDANSRLGVPSESWFLIDLFARFGPGAELDAAELREAAAIVEAHPRYADGWRVALAGLAERLAPNAPLQLSHFIDELFRAETGVPDGGAWGDKTPEYVEHLADLAACFPRSRFINVVRDGRDVYLSLAQRRWSDRGYTPYELGRYWTRCLRSAAAGAALLPTRFLEVKYEDLVLETRATLERVCSFLGVEFEEAMLTAHDQASRVITASESAAGVHDKLLRSPRPSDVARWRKVHGDRSLRLAAGVMAAGLRQAGYQDAPPPFAAAALRAVAACDHLWRRGLRPRLRRMARRFKRRRHAAA